MPNIVAFIQARRTSTRLPGKVDLDLGGMKVMDRVMQAALQAKTVNHAYFALPEDFPEIAEDDVLGRFMALARKVIKRIPVDGIVRLTADCPLMDYQVIDTVVRKFVRHGADYCSNVYPRRTFPDGLDVEVFTPWLLERAGEAAEGSEREHVTPWMHRNAYVIESVKLPGKIDWSHVRLTLDTEEDYQWLKQAINSPRS